MGCGSSAEAASSPRLARVNTTARLEAYREADSRLHNSFNTAVATQLTENTRQNYAGLEEEWDGSSIGHLTNEPGSMVLTARATVQVLGARIADGINGDPNQFQPTPESATDLQNSCRRVAQWFDRDWLPPPRRRRRVQQQTHMRRLHSCRGMHSDLTQPKRPYVESTETDGTARATASTNRREAYCTSSGTNHNNDDDDDDYDDDDELSELDTVSYDGHGRATSSSPATVDDGLLVSSAIGEEEFEAGAEKQRAFERAARQRHRVARQLAQSPSSGTGDCTPGGISDLDVDAGQVWPLRPDTLRALQLCLTRQQQQQQQQLLLQQQQQQILIQQQREMQAQTLTQRNEPSTSTEAYGDIHPGTNTSAPPTPPSPPGPTGTRRLQQVDPLAENERTPGDDDGLPGMIAAKQS